MSDAQFIDELIEYQERNNQNIKAIAAELELSERDLITGASPAEEQKEAAKKALFLPGSVAKRVKGDSAAPDSVLADGFQEKAQTAADLVEQNTQNLAILAEAVGVSKKDIAGDPAATDLDEQKAALFGSEQTTNYDDLSRAEQKAKFFFGDSPPERMAKGWESDGERDPDPRAH